MALRPGRRLCQALLPVGWAGYRGAGAGSAEVAAVWLPLRFLIRPGSAEVGAFQPSFAALNTMGVYRCINAKQQKAAEERKGRVPVRYPLKKLPSSDEEGWRAERRGGCGPPAVIDRRYKNQDAPRPESVRRVPPKGRAATGARPQEGCGIRQSKPCRGGTAGRPARWQALTP